MKEVRETVRFRSWLDNLRDTSGRQRILDRIIRLARGNPGQHRVLRDGVRELKINTGPGYRVYYAEHADRIVLILVGGDKSTQRTDIALAVSLATTTRS